MRISAIDPQLKFPPAKDTASFRANHWREAMPPDVLAAVFGGRPETFASLAAKLDRAVIASKNQPDGGSPGLARSPSQVPGSTGESAVGASEDDHHGANWLPISERPSAVRPAHEDGWDLPLHRQLSAQRVLIAFDGSDSEIAAGAAKADEAIPMREIALDKRFVPFLRMADIADREVEVFRPEERNHHERLIAA